MLELVGVRNGKEGRQADALRGFLAKDWTDIRHTCRSYSHVRTEHRSVMSAGSLLQRLSPELSMLAHVFVTDSFTPNAFGGWTATKNVVTHQCTYRQEERRAVLVAIPFPSVGKALLNLS